MNAKGFARIVLGSGRHQAKVTSFYQISQRAVINTFTPSMGDPMEMSNNSVVVVKFTAKWCGPCKTVAPQYAMLSDHYPSVSFYDIDVDDNSSVSKKFTVRAVPTFIVLNNGKIESRVEGSAIVNVKEAIDKIVSLKGTAVSEQSSVEK